MEMQRRPLPERFLVVEVDSTEELPSEPDPGSAGSSLAFGMSRHPSPSAGDICPCSTRRELQLRRGEPMRPTDPRPVPRAREKDGTGRVVRGHRLWRGRLHGRPVGL